MTSHPAFILFATAALVRLSRGRVRAGLLLAGSVAALVAAASLSPGAHWGYAVGDYDLQLLHVDSLSHLFGLIFALIMAIGALYAVHAARAGEHAATLVYAGGALGAAYVLWNGLLKKPRTPRLPSPYLGPGYSEEQIQDTLDEFGAVYERLDRSDLLERVAALIDTAHVVGWYQGRMEWGPRALGHRSILGDARHPEMRDTINRKIKMREGFRPFAPTVLEEHSQELFALDRPSPYMLLVAPVKKEAVPLPAITHVDGSARVQTINAQQDPLYYDLVHTFYRRTGCPAIINTSMNVRGEPIVNTPKDAYLCFMRTDMDAISMGPFLLHKDAQPPMDLEDAQEAFGLD